MLRHNSDRVSLLLIVPPLSPSDTNPPLGPAVISRSLRLAGHSTHVLDLNAFLFNHGTSAIRSGERRDALLGDQDKNRELTHWAREQVKDASAPSAATHVPCGVHAGLGACMDHREMQRLVELVADSSHTLGARVLAPLRALESAPMAVGVSIMGPPQVLFALAAAKVAKAKWPDVPVIAGGSHITLLADNIAVDPQYGRWIDHFMPGHCEHDLSALLDDLRVGGNVSNSPGVVGGVAPSEYSGFDYFPEFSDEWLSLYGGREATIPLQFSRGCRLRCRMCTYPAAEPLLLHNAAQREFRALEAVDTLSQLREAGFRRLSIKDSLFEVSWMEQLAGAILSRKLDLSWSATTRIDQGVVSKVAGLRRSGLRTLEFGVESIHPEMQGIVGKKHSIGQIETVVRACASADVAVVLNLIYGFPGESRAMAEAQLDWFLRLRKRYGRLIQGSHNLLEINRKAPLADPTTGATFGVRMGGVAPWAFSYEWNAPEWRQSFLGTLAELGEQQP